MVCSGSWWFIVVRSGSWWFVVVCGGLWWFVVVCDPLFNQSEFKIQYQISF